MRAVGSEHLNLWVNGSYLSGRPLIRIYWLPGVQERFLIAIYLPPEVQGSKLIAIFFAPETQAGS
jgi:hypothetical protein